jgi:geranylgeranyl reductase family protein
MPQNFDVIVVGAGPAGSFTSYLLAQKGLNVLIIDKAKFPRYKVCGGGIPYKAQALLPFDLHSIEEADVYNILFSCKYNNVYMRKSDKMLINCYMRENLDNYLLSEAIKAGVKLVEAEKVKQVNKLKNKIIVRTKVSDFTCRIVIGADGENSVVAKSLNLMQKNVSKAYAIESEINVSDSTLKRYEGTVGLDWGTLPNGYGWIFPKKDHLSVGVGGPVSLAKQIKAYYESIILNLNLEVLETKSIQGHMIPFRKNDTKIYSRSSLLVGDAAGLTDPLTGEGIYYALKSAMLGAFVVSEYFEKNIEDLSLYQQKVNDEIMTELNAALPIQYIFNSAPLYFHKMLRDNDRLWSAFCRILRGELSYTVVKSKLPASSVLWHPLVRSAKILNMIKTRKYGK